jgi:MoaA/NifB/PqqE/SkfB family radical SAM enzyme
MIKNKRIFTQNYEQYSGDGVYSLQHLRDAYLKDPNQDNQAAFIGAVAGLISKSPSNMQCNRDYRRYMVYAGVDMRGPRELILYTTDKCDLKCTFCLRQHATITSCGDMTEGQVETVLGKYPSITSCCVAGFGEPLLNIHLYKIMRVLHDRKILSRVITNGVHLVHNINELSTAYTITVSLNAATPEEHASICGCHVWNKVIEGIKKAIASGIRTGVSFVVSQENIDRIPSYIEMAKELGVTQISLYNTLPHVGVNSKKFKKQVLARNSPEAVKLDEMRKTYENSGLTIDWPLLVGDEPEWQCLSPFISMGFDASGAVTGCRRCMPPSLSNGNVLWRNDVWENNYYTNLRLVATGNREIPDMCKGCFAGWNDSTEDDKWSHG